ncbi:MAG TPA: hypothetical protein VNF29_00345 [Candidatus Binataceae bacterium]|nr:hypothetical protein [Candidatus Binataceae bacterium]
MLALEWDELDQITARIATLQARRAAARAGENVGRLRMLAEELERAIKTRADLVSRITARIGA